MTREELIAALERADGPSRELDAAIAAYVGEAVMPFQPDEHAWMCKDGKGGWMPITRPGSRPHTTNDRYVPRYTASLDAALTLVPEGWCPLIGQNVHYHHWSALLQKVVDDEIVDAHAGAATHAIALCIAALKARA